MNVRSHGGRSFARTLYAAATAMAFVVIAIAVSRGRVLQRRHPEVFLGAAPLVGRDPRDGWDWRFGIALLAACAIAVLTMAAVHSGWVARVRLRTLIASASFAAMCFALALALVDGADGVLRGAAHPTEYLANLARTPPAAEFVRTFLDRLDTYSVHVRGHPPAFVLVLKALDAVGLRGAWPVATLSIASVALTVAAALTTVWATAGSAWVRHSAPFLVVAPYALWQVTSADSWYTAIGCSSAAAVAMAVRPRPTTEPRRRRISVALGVVGGLLLGWLACSTYLGAIFAIVPIVIVLGALVDPRRRVRAAITAAAAAAATCSVIAGFALAGFWWLDGARRTRTEYWEGTAQFRHWDYFGWANIAVALIAIGPASFAGLLRLRDRRLWLLSGSALAALVASHLSQYTRGEVERIWLLFYPWLALAAGALAAGTLAASTHAASARVGERGSGRRVGVATVRWVALQAGCAVTLQAALVSKW